MPAGTDEHGRGKERRQRRGSRKCGGKRGSGRRKRFGHAHPASHGLPLCGNRLWERRRPTPDKGHSGSGNHLGMPKMRWLHEHRAHGGGSSMIRRRELGISTCKEIPGRWRGTRGAGWQQDAVRGGKGACRGAGAEDRPLDRLAAPRDRAGAALAAETAGKPTTAARQSSSASLGLAGDIFKRQRARLQKKRLASRACRRPDVSSRSRRASGEIGWADGGGPCQRTGRRFRPHSSAVGCGESPQIQMLQCMACQTTRRISSTDSLRSIE